MASARRTQAQRSAESRAALLEAAVRHLSAHGYTRLRLADVAADAGYTRGALYHQFAGKEELVLAAVGQVRETWQTQVGDRIRAKGDPVRALVDLAHDHFLHCREAGARVLTILKAEFPDQEHPVGAAAWEASDAMVQSVRRLIKRGRSAGVLTPGPKPRMLAAAYLAAIEGLALGPAGHDRRGAELVERTVRGLLGAT